MSKRSEFNDVTDARLRRGVEVCLAEWDGDRRALVELVFKMCARIARECFRDGMELGKEQSECASGRRTTRGGTER